MVETPQQRFEDQYITSSQIMEELGWSRANVFYARKTGKLPGAISVNEGSFFIWERSSIQQYIDAWKILSNKNES